jgi:hypothetical protein
MTIQVEVSPEVEARLAAEAEARGMPVEAYAGKILEENLPVYATGTGKLSPGDVEELSRRLSEGSENLPILPIEVNDRESYYEDRW